MWIQYFLTIQLPSSQMDNFLSEISGPGIWPFPETEQDFFEKDPHPSSAHTVLAENLVFEDKGPEGLELRKALIAEFRAHQAATLLRPEWMPIAEYELRKFFLKKRGFGDWEDVGKVPLSIPRLSPWKDQREFNRFFPGICDEKGFWSEDPRQQDAYLVGERGFGLLIQNRTNNVGLPMSVEIHPHHQDRAGNTLVLITFSTPWSWLDLFSGLLNKPLLRHSGRAVLIWQDKDTEAGWSFCDPRLDICSQGLLDTKTHLTTRRDPSNAKSTLREWNKDSIVAELSRHLPFSPRMG